MSTENVTCFDNLSLSIVCQRLSRLGLLRAKPCASKEFLGQYCMTAADLKKCHVLQGESWPFFRPNFKNMEVARKEMGVDEVNTYIAGRDLGAVR